MTFLEAQQIIDRVKHKDWQFRIFCDMGSDEPRVCVRHRAPDVITGVEDWIQSQTVLPALADLDEKELLNIVYELLTRLVLHELQEHFLVDDKHYRDPHPEVPKSQKRAPLFAQGKIPGGNMFPKSAFKSYGRYNAMTGQLITDLDPVDKA